MCPWSAAVVHKNRLVPIDNHPNGALVFYAAFLCARLSLSLSRAGAPITHNILTYHSLQARATLSLVQAPVTCVFTARL